MANNDDTPPEPTGRDGRLSVLIEMRATPGASAALSMSAATGLGIEGFEIDHEFQPVSLGGEVGAEGLSTSLQTYILRGTVRSEKDIEKLKANPEVAGVWRDTPIAPFAASKKAKSGKEPKATTASDSGLGASTPIPDDNLGTGTCPIGTCDCQPWVAKGNMADVATYLGVDQIWARGFRGTGIVVGVLDSGMTALGRPVKAGETARRIPRVIGGWPSDWGTESGKWGNHGNMCGTDVLGMAPEAQLYDLRIAGAGGSPGTISRALQAFQWAIDRHRVDGTPHVLTNSWGIFQESWDPSYARNPNHPFTRKVVEAINEGIIVLFAAGNCGSTCPDGRCGPDNGPGRSIWGANSHPRVMTVGAVNKNEQFVGYSSQGPGALDANKPDFCSITHFLGYNASDSGTSAATPILAGVCALLKQANSSLQQDAMKDCLKRTAKDIGPTGFDQHSGAGIVQAKAAFDRCGRRIFKIPILDTIPSRDRLRTLPTLDRITTVVRDRLTLPYRDIVTTPLRDQVTSPVIDRIGTNPRIDFAKSPHLDTLQERIPDPRDRFRDPVLPPIRGGQQPFVLSTPHQAEDWEYFDEMGGQQGGQMGGDAEAMQLASEIEALSAQLEVLMQAYEQMMGGGADGDCCQDDGDPYQY